ncbi:MAG: histidinol-phosphate aminotransferase [Gammaproteobacteria bacterium]|jgi:histidinol-phosphate aminotransferase
MYIPRKQYYEIILGMNKFWSDNLDTLTPYEAGEQPQDKSYIKLNTNENPYPPSDAVLNAIKQATSDQLRLYPDPNALKLKQAIAKFYSIKTDNIFVGNGSDEVLGFTIKALFKKTGAILFPDITYSFYPTYCRLFDINFQTFPLTDKFEINIDLIPEDNCGIIIANPNASTGICLAADEIEEILKRHPNNVVMIDEAYIDFGGKTCIPLINNYPNLVVIQTVSKSRSLAGLRVGLAIADAGLIEGIQRVKNSFNAYPLDSLAIAGATAAFEDKESYINNKAKVLDTREWTITALEKLSFYVVPSSTNFIMAQHKEMSAKSIYLKLKDEGILIRYFDLPRIDNFIRVTVGTKDEMNTLVLKLEKILGARSPT